MTLSVIVINDPKVLHLVLDAVWPLTQSMSNSFDSVIDISVHGLIRCQRSLNCSL